MFPVAHDHDPDFSGYDHVQRVDQSVWRCKQRNTAIDLRHQQFLKIGGGKTFVQQNDLGIRPQLTGAGSLGERFVGGLCAQDYKLGFIVEG